MRLESRLRRGITGSLEKIEEGEGVGGARPGLRPLWWAVGCWGWGAGVGPTCFGRVGPPGVLGW